jgi:hypothetical protein
VAGIADIPLGLQDNLSLVVEYVPLGDLCSLLRREPLSLSVKIQLLMGTAAALCHLHQENVVHRDLAARNLLVTLANGNYEVKVTDFGLSRKSKGTYESSTGFGPLKWMAPESIHPKTKLFSKASDVWAFGVVIWVPYSIPPRSNAKNVFLNRSLHWRCTGDTHGRRGTLCRHGVHRRRNGACCIWFCGTRVCAMCRAYCASCVVWCRVVLRELANPVRNDRRY